MMDVMEIGLTIESEGNAQDGLITLRNEISRLKKENDELKRDLAAAKLAQEDDEFLANRWVSMDTDLHHLRIANSELHSLVANLESQLFAFKISLEKKQEELKQLHAIEGRLGASEATLKSHRATSEILASKVQDLSLENQELRRSNLNLQQSLRTDAKTAKKNGYNPKFVGNMSKAKAPAEHAAETETAILQRTLVPA